jgi:hypothetical protein
LLHEHVVGPVGDADDGTRGAGACRGDAADGVQAQDLAGVGEQAVLLARPGGPEVQLGDVAVAVRRLGQDRPGDRAAVGGDPLRGAGAGCDEGVPDAPVELRLMELSRVELWLVAADAGTAAPPRAVKATAAATSSRDAWR